MIGIRSRKKDAEATRAYLKAHKLMDNQHIVVRGSSFIYFPVTRIDDKALRRLKELGATKVEMQFKASEKRSGYREALLKELGKPDYDNTIKSYDLVGDTAIVDADRKSAVKLAKAIMSVNRNVKRVIRKAGAVTGRYRTREFSHVAGERGYVVRYRENGITLELDIRKSFFSPRLAYERKRISGLVRDKENVIVMFAGVGPYAILIAKEHPGCKVIAMELNRNAYNYLVENVRLNRLSNVIPVLGDVRKTSTGYRQFADRIVMPLPKDGYGFVGAAVSMAKPHCTIHYYAFANSKDPYSHNTRSIGRLLAKFGKKARFIGMRIVRTYSSTEVEIALDFVVS